MFKHCLFLALAISVSAISANAVLAGETGRESKAKTSLIAKNESKYPIFFVTDRKVRASAHGPEFTSDRSDQLTYGSYRASDLGKDDIEAKDAMLYKSKEEFFSQLRSTGSSSVAVFVHGYRKSFDGSLQFAGKVAGELNQPVVLFAWPSKNKYSAYMTDECTAEWSSYHLAALLNDMSNQFGSANTNLISHSLGSRIVSWSLRQVAIQKQMIAPFGSNILFSPDVDRDTFVAESSFLKQACKNVRIYLDSHDTRIWVSMVLHGSPRVGNADNSMIGNIFPYDATMPSHQIPYSVLSGALPTPVAAAVPAPPRQVEGVTHLSASATSPVADLSLGRN